MKSAGDGKTVKRQRMKEKNDGELRTWTDRDGNRRRTKEVDGRGRKKTKNDRGGQTGRETDRELWRWKEGDGNRQRTEHGGARTVMERTYQQMVSGYTGVHCNRFSIWFATSPYLWVDTKIISYHQVLISCSPKSPKVLES